jgi:phage head maturation protease
MTAVVLQETLSEVEVRSSQVAAVSFPHRLIEVIVMPYESEAMVGYQGRVISEVVSRGAYDGIEARNGRVRANRDHNIHDPVGRAVRLHPSRLEGLVAEVQISKTDRGHDTLELANDGVLDASAGFGLLRRDGRTGPVVENAETWLGRNVRRLNRLWLDHIAFTADPAYPGAHVVDVRDGRIEPRTVTPNRDRLRLDEWQRQAAELDARFGV